VDKIVIGMMRPLYDKGIRPHNMSDLLLELHSKKYHHRYIRRERLLAKGVAPGSLDTFLGPSLGARTSMYSTFADKTKYAGLVPTGEWMRAHNLTMHTLSLSPSLILSLSLSLSLSLARSLSFSHLFSLCLICLVLSFSLFFVLSFSLDLDLSIDPSLALTLALFPIPEKITR
jgi:hypothetical protein